MNKANNFTFKNYSFSKVNKKAIFTYNVDGQEFHETYTFGLDFVSFSTKALDRALQNLFFLAGISYYKAFLPKNISVEKGKIDYPLSQFLSKTYQRGLGEFFYVNNLDPNFTIAFPTNTETIPSTIVSGTGQLIAVGGGKDSLVSIESLRNKLSITTWSVGHKKQLQPLVETIGLPHFWIERHIDSFLIAGRAPYIGHVPISAIIAGVGTVVAILSGKQDVVMSNESSADEPTLQYRGTAINHQYSKSSVFEKDYQSVLSKHFGNSLRYYSFLRPYSELQITELFATHFEKYKSTFGSCNKAFRQNEDHLFWCGKCPKCAFVFLMLSPFVNNTAVQKLFGGKNLLLNPKLHSTYEELLGITEYKPLECIGTIKECRWAMDKAKENYPTLKKSFDYPKVVDFNTKALHQNSIPEDVVHLLPNLG